MPFKSQAQRGWMYSNEPEMAKRWEKETPKGKLPGHVAKKKAKKKPGKAKKKPKTDKGDMGSGVAGMWGP